MNKKYRVVIDPGHGGKDSGAVGPTGLKESDVVLAVGHETRRYLESVGIEALMTREDDRFLSLNERADFANLKAADLFISIHNNSAVNPAWGIETFIARKTQVSYPLAESVQDALTLAFPDTPDRGVKRRNFTVLTATSMPAVLAELEFIHTPCGEEILRDPQNQRAYGHALGAGVAEFLGVVDTPFFLDPLEPEACEAVDLAKVVMRHATALITAAEKF